MKWNITFWAGLVWIMAVAFTDPHLNPADTYGSDVFRQTGKRAELHSKNAKSSCNKAELISQCNVARHCITMQHNMIRSGLNTIHSIQLERSTLLQCDNFPELENRLICHSASVWTPSVPSFPPSLEHQWRVSSGRICLSSQHSFTDFGWSIAAVSEACGSQTPD